MLSHRLGIGCFVLGSLVVSSAHAALLLDDFEGDASTNTLGGLVVSFSDETSGGDSLVEGLRVEGHESPTALRIAYDLRGAYEYPFVGVATELAPDAEPVDLSEYAGVRFWARGEGGAAVVVNVGIPATLDEHNHYGATLLLSEDWQLYQVPFDSLEQTWGTPETWDPSVVVKVDLVLRGGAGLVGHGDFDAVEFYSADEEASQEVVVREPRVNQVGYLADAHKVFSIIEGPAAAGDGFEVARDGEVVHTGTLTGPIDARATAGEMVLLGDFTALSEPGTYVIRVGDVSSPPFDIGDDVYTAVYRDAARVFYPIRSGVPIDDPISGIAYSGAHADDAPLLDDPSVVRDLSGGWYNAGDFGKWVHMAGVACSYMMLLHELKGERVSRVNLSIPESNNDLPDLLDQARWGLEWMLKMQLEDGSVLHKVDSGDDFGWGVAPHEHDAQRFATAPSSMDAAWLVGTALIGERVFRSYDAAFADQLRDAAERAFSWLVANPDVRHDDPFYQYFDDSQHQEYLFALSEMARATNDPSLIEELRGEVETQSLVALSWMDPQILGYFSVATAPNLDAELRAATKAKIVSAAQTYATLAEADAHGVSAGPDDYYWGSVENILNRTSALIFAYELSDDVRFRHAALSQLDFVLGRNALARSYVVGHGEGAIRHPYHWAHVALGVALPGWTGGGPNNQDNGGDGLLDTACGPDTAPQKCHVDSGGSVGSWASNEGQISEAGSLVFAVGYFAQVEEGPIPDNGEGGAGADRPTTKTPSSSGCGCQTGKDSGNRLSALGLLLALAIGYRRRGSSWSARAIRARWSRWAPLSRRAKQ